MPCILDAFYQSRRLGTWLFLILVTTSTFCQATLPIGSELDDQCVTEELDASMPASLLQVHRSGSDDKFGPGGCVRLSKSDRGSCVLSTKCQKKDISDTEFAFVCYSPQSTIPHALHSFGRGGFDDVETFDTNVECKTCMSVSTAFRTGGSMVRNALAALPLSRLPSLTESSSTTNIADLDFKPEEAAVFGPSYCISTFLAPSGTCLIRTRCTGVDISKFNIGLTCLDKSGGYTRYLFGKDSFKPSETFDTMIGCEKCLGVGPESSMFAMHGLMPRRLLDDVGSLKTDVLKLTEEVKVLRDFHSHEGDAHAGGGPEKDENTQKVTSHSSHSHSSHTSTHSHYTALEQTGNQVPTIMIQKGGEAAPTAPAAAWEQSESAEASQQPGEEPSAEALNDQLPIMTHRRAPALTELLKLANRGTSSQLTSE